MRLVREVGIRPEIVTVRGVHRERDGYLKLYVYTNGKGEPRAFARCGSGASVTVLPFDAIRREVILIEQPRSLLPFSEGITEARNILCCADHGGTPNPIHFASSGVLSLEGPGGMVEEGETALEAACRELKEETLITVSKETLIHRGTQYPSNGILTQRVDCYFAPVDTAAFGASPERFESGTGESIRVYCLPFDEAFALAERGEIHAPCTLDLLQALHIRCLKGLI